MAQGPQVLSYSEFHDVVQEEVVYMESATPYRRDTAHLALKALETVNAVKPFSTREEAYETVKALYHHLDEDRLKDVAKFLNTLYKHRVFFDNLSDETLNDLKQQFKMQTTFKLKPFVKR